MTYAGDMSFVNRVRETLRNALEQEKDGLVYDTTERRAGRVEGLYSSLLLIDEIVRAHFDYQPPEENNG